MKLISPTDSMFLLGESREHPMHVGGLQLFDPPRRRLRARTSCARCIRAMVAQHDFQPTFRKHPATVLGWHRQRRVDLRRRRRPRLPPEAVGAAGAGPRARPAGVDVTPARHPARPAPAAVGGPSDRGAQRRAVRGLRQVPPRADRRGVGAEADPAHAVDRPRRHRDSRAVEPAAETAAPSDTGRDLARCRRLGRTVGSVAALAPSTLSLARAALLEQQLTLPFGAPKTMFNVPIGGARRVAAQSWPLERIRSIKAAAGVTVNDVVLAMCAGALRGYLVEQNALPDAPADRDGAGEPAHGGRGRHAAAT